MSGSNGAETEAPKGAQIGTLAQYLKDFSFENPNAPRSLGPQEQAPNINVQVNVNAKQLSEADFEVSLKLDGAAGEGANTLFKFELEYCGVFRLINFPAEQVHPVVMIECPRLLFPFARNIVANSVNQGGFPPLYLDPIDFGALYMQRTNEAQNLETNKALS